MSVCDVKFLMVERVKKKKDIQGRYANKVLCSTKPVISLDVVHSPLFLVYICCLLYKIRLPVCCKASCHLTGFVFVALKLLQHLPDLLIMH